MEIRESSPRLIRAIREIRGFAILIPGNLDTGSPQATDNSKSAYSDLGFYRAAEPKKAEDRLERPAVAKSGSPAPAAKTAGANPMAKNASAKSKSLLNSPLIPRGAVVLQVAAVKNERDALALAEALQTKKFPAFVLTPGADAYYRVQVGPYADMQSASVAKQGLEQQGFKSIVKR